MRPQKCYGQDGEDLVLSRYFEGQSKGFFIDVGAHHPARFSNTYMFYKKGWKGINIDAQLGTKALFDRVRPRDINIECGVAKENGVLVYHRFNEPALNTFDEQEAKLKDKIPYKIIEKIEVQVRRLEDILDEYIEECTEIDFMSVDVEGLDLDVLRSNNWNKYRPRYILAETLRVDIENLHTCEIVQFLVQKGYVPLAKVYNTTFFSLKEI